MAESLSHRWGQIIGDVLEAATLPLLLHFAEERGLYLDREGVRPARASKKATWIDVNGNRHDLDYVLERGGSPEQIGRPIAFIETAWRRYTKHSRNKAQEIQGAVMPLVAMHRNSAPFTGAILAGVFTAGALEQLRSLGFTILFFPYEGVIAAFETVGINAAFNETTAEGDFREKIAAWVELGDAEKASVSLALTEAYKHEVDTFLAKLSRSVAREIEAVFVLPLHGNASTLQSVASAIRHIEEYNNASGESKPVVHYLVEVRYNTGEQVSGKFNDKESAVQFLHTFQPPVIVPA